ncbi:MAG: ABC transporter permease subunit [Dehalococcoidia bacterium]
MSGTSRLPLLRKALRDLRNPLIAYGGGLAALGIMYVGLFPSYQDMLSSFELPSEYSAFFGDITNLSTLSAFIQIEFFSLWLPLLLAIFAIVSGTSQIAGDEQAGRLEVILSQPISRRRLFAERGGALLIGAVLICLACSLGFLVAWPLFVENADVSLGRALLAPLGLVGFGWFFVGLALFTGALTATRGQATAIMTAITVLTYLADVLRDLVPGLGPLRFVSPFFYGDTKRMFTDGAIPWHQAALFLGVAIVLLAALRTFEAREIGTERSPLRWRPRRSSRGSRGAREASRPAEQPRG